MNNTFKIIKLLIDEAFDIHGVDAISLVHDPAIERDFVHFHKEFITDFKEVQGEKRIVVGPLLIPNKMILRKNGEDYFYVYFDNATIAKTAERFQMNSYQNNTTLEHDSELKNITFIETWIKQDMVHDKSALYGLDLPKGSWVVSMKIDNDEIYEKAKKGEVKGFSIEGYFADKYDLNTNLEEIETINKLKELLK